MLINFKDEDFEKKIKSEEISICQFSASWCNPCKSLKPILDKLSDTYKDKAQNWFYCDVEDGAINTGSAMGIRGGVTHFLPVYNRQASSGLPDSEGCEWFYGYRKQ